MLDSILRSSQYKSGALPTDLTQEAVEAHNLFASLQRCSCSTTFTDSQPIRISPQTQPRYGKARCTHQGSAFFMGTSIIDFARDPALPNTFSCRKAPLLPGARSMKLSGLFAAVESHSIPSRCRKPRLRPRAAGSCALEC